MAREMGGVGRRGWRNWMEGSLGWGGMKESGKPKERSIRGERERRH